ncbi:Contactin-5, partial [Cichlidogyrus casuarinus]
MPKNVTGGGGKYQTLVVRWEPLLDKDRNGDNFHYMIHFRSKGDAEFTKVPVSIPQLLLLDEGKYVQYTITLNQEAFYKPYEVAVQAINKEGSGPLSEVSLVMSAARVPLNAPRDIIAGAENSTAITVWWNKPEVSSGVGPILGYRIIYYPRNNTDCRSVDSLKTRYTRGERQTVHGDITTGKIIGLDADVYYCILVQMYNSAGDGPDSSTTEQTTFKKAPSGMPTFVTLNATDFPMTLKVSWAGVQSLYEEESIQGYTIRYWVAGADFKETLIDVNVGLRTYGFITNLTMDTRYELRVFAYSRGGIGTYSSPVNSFQFIDSSLCVPGASYGG